MSRPEPVRPGSRPPQRPPSRPAGSREAQGPYDPHGPHEGRGRREPMDATGGPAGSPGPRENAAAPAIRLTGRGGILALMVLAFLGLLGSDLVGWGLLSNVTFVAGCIAIASYARPTDLLPVTVCPPLAFFVACVCSNLITSSDGTSAAEGILVTLADSAPWLFLGTALTIVIALRRGLLDNIRVLRHGLQGQPDGTPRARARNIMAHGPDSVRARRR
ncbi:MAG: DUF6542 domain-containing protein [Streptosporangiaceae bacterium]